jgi:uncharacterized protein with PIN domain
MVNKNSNPKCSQCGSELIFVSRETVQPEGTRYPQTNTIYRCSNEECQKKKDKDKVDRQKQRQNRENTEEERLKKIQEKRSLGRKLKAS